MDAPVIRFQLTEDDLRRVHQILSGTQRPPALAAMLALWVIVAPLLPFVPFMISRRFFEAEVLTAYCLVVIMSLALVLVAWAGIGRTYRRWLNQAETKRFLQPAEMRIDASGLHYRTPVARGHVAWPMFASIGTTSDREYAFLSLGPGMAYIIPARAFEDQHAMDSFVEQACNLQLAHSRRGMICRQCGYDLRADPDAGCPECGWLRIDGDERIAHDPPW